MIATPDRLPDLRVLAGREVWLFAAAPFDFALLGRTRALAVELSALGVHVVFVEPPSLKKTLRRILRPSGAPGEIEVVGMPATERRITDRLPWIAKLHDRLQRRWLVNKLGNRKPIALVCTPRWTPVIEQVPFEAVFYDCIDDLRVHAAPGLLAEYERWEKALIARSRACFAVTPSLSAILSERGAADVIIHRNGVDFDTFERRGAPAAPKGERRRIGYLGAIFEWVDVPLLEYAARALPEHEFQLVGPIRRGIDVSALRRLPNVQLPGYLPYADVPRVMASFDVSLIPFIEGEVARGADPIKVYEYFCFGTPVVTTPVSDVERIADMLYIASGPEAFVAGIRAALAERNPDLRKARITYARENDWPHRARSLAEEMARRLDGRQGGADAAA